MTPFPAEMRAAKVLVVGMGRSGIAAARFLLGRGAQVTATDSRPLEQLDRSLVLLESAGVTLHVGGHIHRDFLDAELIVVSPGVPLTLDGLKLARRAAVPIVSEIDLVPPALGARTIAITGSNGKSTTTALTAAMLAAAGREEIPCGNFGIPFIEAVAGDTGKSWYALELSSFQLETTRRLRAAAGVILNLQADHLDRHGSFENYRLAKWKLAELLQPHAPLVLCIDDEHVAKLAQQLGEGSYQVSVRHEVPRGGWLAGDRLFLRIGAQVEDLGFADEMPIPGQHNLLNILAAAVACRASGITLEQLRAGLASFGALPHRLQEVTLSGGVSYVDDSKATNVGASIQALRSYPGRRILVLLGGRDKDGDFHPLAEEIMSHDAVAITFGEAGPLIASILNSDGVAEVHRAGTMEEAIDLAHGMAASGDIVLLSPACASFDAFRGFDARGDAFAAKARTYAEVEA